MNRLDSQMHCRGSTPDQEAASSILRTRSLILFLVCCALMTPALAAPATQAERWLHGTVGVRGGAGV